MDKKPTEDLLSIGERLERSPILRISLILLLAAIATAVGIYTNSTYIKAAVALVLALAIAQIIELVIGRNLQKIAEKTGNTIDDKVVSTLHRPLFWTAILLGVVVAVSLAKLPQGLEETIKSLVFSVLVFLWMLFALQVSKVLLQTISRRTSNGGLISTHTLPLFTNLVAVIIVALAIYFIFQAWHIDMTAWLASAGIIGIAVGFAAKDTLANLFSGVFIMADSFYKLGDYVVIDENVRGKITHMGIRSTRLLTRDDVEVTIPNSLMGNSKVVNESGGPHEKYRIRVKLGVAYGSDVDQINDLLVGIAESEPEVCEKPEPRVRFRAFGPSSLDLELLAWVDEPELRGKVVHKLIMTIYKRLQQEGIEIPYNKQELFIKEMPQPTPTASARRKTTKKTTARR
jgi:small-conductance mechanosensitive channel